MTRKDVRRGRAGAGATSVGRPLPGARLLPSAVTAGPGLTASPAGQRSQPCGRANKVRTPWESSVRPCGELASMVSDRSLLGHWEARAPSGTRR